MLKNFPQNQNYNFFIDDNIFFFDDLYQHHPRSIFDQFYLGGLKKAHELYGTCFTLNTFVVNWHHLEFQLSELGDRYRGEFEANSRWLRLAFHGYIEYPKHPYLTAFPEKLPEHFHIWQLQMERIAGPRTLIAPVLIHYIKATDDCRKFMRSQGMKIYGNCNGTPIHYNTSFDQYEIPVDIFLNKYSPSEIRRILQEKINAGQQTFLIGSHEQNAYPSYVRYLPDYFEGLFTACRLMYNHHYQSCFFNEII